LVSAPNAPNRSGRGREDRRLKFYELPDNLFTNVATGTALRAVTLTGVTKDRITAGSHTLRIAAGNDHDASVIVLGN
jgi:hypothetical protein